MLSATSSCRDPGHCVSMYVPCFFSLSLSLSLGFLSLISPRFSFIFPSALFHLVSLEFGYPIRDFPRDIFEKVCEKETTVRHFTVFVIEPTRHSASRTFSPRIATFSEFQVKTGQTNNKHITSQLVLSSDIPTSSKRKRRIIVYGYLVTRYGPQLVVDASG